MMVFWLMMAVPHEVVEEGTIEDDVVLHEVETILEEVSPTPPKPKRSHKRRVPTIVVPPENP